MMAKGRVRKPSQPEPEASGATSDPASKAPAAVGKGLRKKDARKAARAEKGLRKHLKRLESQVLDATKAEAKRLRKLEKARWRRQLLEAFLDEARIEAGDRAPSSTKNASVAGSSPAAVEQTQPAKAKATAKPKRPLKAHASANLAAAKKPAPAAEAQASSADAKPVEAYCLREKKRVQMLDPKPVVTKSGGSALSGTCPSCGAALYKLVGRAAR